MYAIRDSQTDEFFAPHRDDELEKKVMAVTSDLYSLADKANTHAMPAKKEVEVLTNDHCICIGQTIYNSTPPGLPDLREADQAISRETPPPSLRITVAALLEAATSERRTHTQASLIETILERNRGIRGLSESSLQKHFSDSNAELSRLRKSVQN